MIRTWTEFWHFFHRRWGSDRGDEHKPRPEYDKQEWQDLQGWGLYLERHDQRAVHINLPVSNVMKMAQWYALMFGFEYARGQAPSTTIAYLWRGPVLLVLAKGKQLPATFHFGFMFPFGRIEEELARLKGIGCVFGAIQKSEHYIGGFTKDPEGNRIEIFAEVMR